MEESKILEILNLRNTLIVECKRLEEMHEEICDYELVCELKNEIEIIKGKISAINQVFEILGYSSYISSD